MSTRKLILYLCSAALIIIGLYNLIFLSEYYAGTIWTAVGIFFLVLGHFRIKN